MSTIEQKVQQSTVRNQLPLILFVFGIGFVVFVLLVPGLRAVVFHIAENGPLGAFVTGILYTIGFTAPLATAMVVDAAHSAAPWTLALIGGLGAMVYDLLIFAFVRRTSTQPFFTRVREKFLGRPAISWTLAALGALVIASPLPDELGSGLFGISKIPQKYFMPLAFVLNAFGIFVIASLAR